MSGQFVFGKSDLEWQMHFLLMNFFTDISQTAIADSTLYSKLGLDKENETHRQILINVLEYMVADNLIYPTDTGYKLTLHGYKVRQNEGYLKYLDKIDADGQRQRDNIESAILTNNSVRINMWCTLAVVAITGAGTILQSYISYKDRQDRLEKKAKQTANPHHRHRCLPYVPRNRLDHVSNCAKTDTKHEKQILKPTP